MENTFWHNSGYHVGTAQVGSRSKWQIKEHWAALWLSLKVRWYLFGVGAVWDPWFYRAQNKTLIAVGFLSAPTLPLCDDMAGRFSQKAAFYGAAACWRAASVCSADFNCLSVAIKNPVKYTTVKELRLEPGASREMEMKKTLGSGLMEERSDKDLFTLKFKWLDAFQFGKWLHMKPINQVFQ